MGHLPAWVDGDAPEDEPFVRFDITPENSIDAFDTCSALVMLPATLLRPRTTDADSLRRLGSLPTGARTPRPGGGSIAICRICLPDE